MNKLRVDLLWDNQDAACTKPPWCLSEYYRIGASLAKTEKHTQQRRPTETFKWSLLRKKMWTSFIILLGLISRVAADPSMYDYAEIKFRLYGGYVEYAYWFTDMFFGFPTPQAQSLIIDTGSALTAFYCSTCESCGIHEYPPFQTGESKTVKGLSCSHQCETCDSPYPSLQKNPSARFGDPRFARTQSNQCGYRIEYIEGTTLKGVIFKDYTYVNMSLAEYGLLKKGLSEVPERTLILPVEFGCHKSENHLFLEQTASGIVGLEPENQYVSQPLMTRLLDLMYRNREAITPYRSVKATDMLGMESNMLLPHTADTLKTVRQLKFNEWNKTHPTKPTISICMSGSGGIMSLGGYNNEFHRWRLPAGHKEAYDPTVYWVKPKFRKQWEFWDWVDTQQETLERSMQSDTTREVHGENETAFYSSAQQAKHLRRPRTEDSTYSSNLSYNALVGKATSPPRMNWVRMVNVNGNENHLGGYFLHVTHIRVLDSQGGDGIPIPVPLIPVPQYLDPITLIPESKSMYSTETVDGFIAILDTGSTQTIMPRITTTHLLKVISAKVESHNRQASKTESNARRNWTTGFGRLTGASMRDMERQLQNRLLSMEEKLRKMRDVDRTQTTYGKTHSNIKNTEDVFLKRIVQNANKALRDLREFREELLKVVAKEKMETTRTVTDAGTRNVSAFLNVTSLHINQDETHQGLRRVLLGESILKKKPFAGFKMAKEDAETLRSLSKKRSLAETLLNPLITRKENTSKENEEVDGAFQAASKEPRVLGEAPKSEVLRYRDNCWLLPQHEAQLAYFPNIEFTLGNQIQFIWRPEEYLALLAVTESGSIWCYTFDADSIDSEEMDESENSFTNHNLVILDALRNGAPEVATRTLRRSMKSSDLAIVFGATFFLYHDIAFHLGNFSVGIAPAGCPETNDYVAQPFDYRFSDAALAANFPLNN